MISYQICEFHAKEHGESLVYKDTIMKTKL